MRSHRILAVAAVLSACVTSPGAKPVHIADSALDTGGTAETGVDSADTAPDTAVDSAPSADADADGYANAAAGGTDCNDADATVHPDQTDDCSDGIDADCDPTTCGLASSSLSMALSVTTDGLYSGPPWTVAGAGDVNGDGFGDAVIANSEQYYAASAPGSAYLFLGSATPASTDVADMPVYTGEADDDYARQWVAGAGDVNADGFADVLIGGWGNDDGGDDAGAAYLVLGTAAPTSASLHTAIEYVGQTRLAFAGPVGSAGDVNDDGFDDILIGSPGFGSDNQGRANLVLGRASPAPTKLSTTIAYASDTHDELAGALLSGGGDVNGDGFDDAIVGTAGNWQGDVLAYVILGEQSPLSSALADSVKYTSSGDGSYALGGVAGGGDVNGDGYADMIVGGPEQYFDFPLEGGGVYLVLGSARPTSSELKSSILYRGQEHDEAGAAVSCNGDVDADGFDDILVGALGSSDGGESAGAAYLMFGDAYPASDTLAHAREYTGDSAFESAGASVAIAPDLNGDAFDDILIATFGDNSAYGEAGNDDAAYLLLGGTR